MRSSQWFVLSIFCFLFFFLFISIDNNWNCDLINSSSLTKGDILGCINSEILDPFIWLLFPLAITFQINGWIEFFYEKKKKI